MEQNYLATYRNGDNFEYAWFGTEEEALEWIDIESQKYTNVEVVELKVVNVLFERD
jgi:hypothetical protein